MLVGSSQVPPHVTMACYHRLGLPSSPLIICLLADYSPSKWTMKNEVGENGFIANAAGRDQIDLDKLERTL
jgi:hypothetical protein